MSAHEIRWSILFRRFKFTHSAVHKLTFISYENLPTSLSQISVTLDIIYIRYMCCEYRWPSLFADFYLRINLFTLENLIKNANFLVRKWLFICKISIRGPKWRIKRKNNGNLYHFVLPCHIAKKCELFCSFYCTANWGN